MYADVHNICLTYTPAHAWCSQHLSKCIPRSPQKMHMHSCMRAYARVQKLLCHRGYCKLTLSLARASCRLSFAARFFALPTVSTKPVADAVRSRNLSKSTPALDAVTAAVSHKHHSIICVGAGLIQFVYGLKSRLAMQLICQRILFSPWFSWAFSSNIPRSLQKEQHQDSRFIDPARIMRL